jgi:hypothetical protein
MEFVYDLGESNIHMYLNFYENVVVPTFIRFWNIKLYTDTFTEGIVAVVTDIIFACVRNVCTLIF